MGRACAARLADMVDVLLLVDRDERTAAEAAASLSGDDRRTQVDVISPGIIDTPMGRQEAASRSTNDLLVRRTPLGHEGHPEDVASAVAFLLSNEAIFIKDIDILVGGAWSTPCDPPGLGVRTISPAAQATTGRLARSGGPVRRPLNGLARAGHTAGSITPQQTVR